ncbi:hypothetical protein LTR56_013424 [Elasticomyces elasticus]|nr:hypothetical protein LTR22_025161 [Elasticomyces elasticus]KAK3637821.1 hypothetical protein LTR56_013424 [Elasticomyces elasticus]KAK4905071.1 hypothetical protein LTR49_025599 [Elasticomyces elasticus]KAK5753884.1 hypothetical protein LTS12_015976 [Elasticomyces elasticus]
MPPKHSKKTVDAPVPTMIPSPVKQRPAGITQAQKQALIDNLQLEITERARKLRAQYALQAQGLRTRLEMRVNRIPPAMRKRKMGDLVDEYARKNEPKEPEQTSIAVLKSPVKAMEVERKSLKRQSEFISVTNADDDDKENAPQPASSQQDQQHHDPLPNPKKRAKPTPNTTTSTANTKATRTTSRKVIANHPVVVVPAPPHGGVLSPKSHNSRTLPRSPFKHPGLSPEKQAMVERLTGVSPVKQQIQQQQQQYMLAPKAAVRAPSRQTKTPVEDIDEGRSSEGSTGTTIVTKPAVSKVGRLAAAKKAVVAKTTGAGGRKAAAAKKENLAPVAGVPVGGGRTLRKRG